MADKQPAHVEQALAEYAGATSEDQKRAAEKRLDAAGYERAAKARKAATDDVDADEAKTAPKGRRTPSEVKSKS